jgi:NAD(P)-dependent dehydrogenase (short-subunit alcohol dehydrogenase family)
MSLAGKTAVVTGGTGALGKAIVERFLREGVRVAVSYRESSKLDLYPADLRSLIVAIQADTTKEEDVKRLFQSAASHQGSVDILVNTVGGFLPKKNILEVSLEEWERMMNINLKSSVLCLREALRHMKGRPYGRIVNFSAMSALSPSAGRAPYAIAKGGVSVLTEIAAQEVKGTGITINAIAPSIIDTEENRLAMPDEDSSRWVKRESIADLVCYLCGDSAQAVTGTTIRASGSV